MKYVVALILKDPKARIALMSQIGALRIPYFEAPDLREAKKRMQEDWNCILVCYDAHGVGLENCHNYEVVLRHTAELREKCGFPPLILIDECVNEDNRKQFVQDISSFDEILNICPIKEVPQAVTACLSLST